MKNRTFAIFSAPALAATMAVAQSSNPAPAQQDNAGQQVGIADQSATTNATQQPADRRPANPQRQAKFLARQLALSPAQQAQITPIIADRQQQIETLRADPSLAPRDRRARVESAMQDSRTRIEAVLTDSQKQQFEQLQADHRSRRRQQPQPAQTQPQQQPQAQ